MYMLFVHHCVCGLRLADYSNVRVTRVSKMLKNEGAWLLNVVLLEVLTISSTLSLFVSV